MELIEIEIDVTRIEFSKSDFYFPTAEEIAKGFDFTNQVAIVTGANTGIGKETAKVLTLKNCHVIMACRSVQKGMEAREEILKAIGQGNLQTSMESALRDWIC